MKKTKIAVGNLGEEETYQMKLKVETRAASRAIAQAMFPLAAQKSSKRDIKLMKNLFVQAPGSENMSQKLYGINKTAHVDAFFEKISSMTVAQVRYPELLKAAEISNTVTTSLKRRASAPPVKSNLSGGSA